MFLINNHFKTFLISLLSLTLLFSISCNDAYKPSDKEPSDKGGTTGGETRTLSYYAGDWLDTTPGKKKEKLFTINSDGSVIIYDVENGNYNIPPSSITKNSDTSYTGYYAETSVNIQFSFTSDTAGRFTFGKSESAGITVTKE